MIARFSILSLLLLSSFLLTNAGCASPADTEDGKSRLALEPGFVSSCSVGPIALVGAVTPDKPTDYLSHRSETKTAGTWDVKVNAEKGTLCGTATDVAACRAKVDKLRVLTSACDSMPECNTHYYLYTRGDDVGVVTERDDVVSFIGHIDNAEEAIERARLAHFYQTWCGPGDVPTQYKPTADGYEIITQQLDCGAEGEVIRLKVRLKVDTAGNVSVMSSDEASRTFDPPSCTSQPTK